MTSSFTAKDLVSCNRLVPPFCPSKDGKSVLFCSRQYNYDSDKVSLNIAQVTLANENHGIETRTLSTGASDTTPLYIHDEILFLSSRAGTQQVYCLPSVGEAYAVTSLPIEVDNLKLASVSHDVIHVCFSAEVYPSMSPQETVAFDESKASTKSTGIIFDHLMVRHWDRWGAYEKRNHMFCASLIRDQTHHWHLDKIIDVMLNMSSDCPSKPFGGSEDYAVVDCGDDIKMTIACRPEAECTSSINAWSTNISLLSTTINKSSLTSSFHHHHHHHHQLSGSKAWKGNPVYSPDGSILACFIMTNEQHESDRRRVMMMMANHDPVELMANVDVSFSELTWMNSNELILIGQYYGNSRIFKFNISESVLSIHNLKGSTNSVVKLNDDCIVFAHSTLNTPPNMKMINIHDDSNFSSFVFESSFANGVNSHLGDVVLTDLNPQVPAMLHAPQHVDVYFPSPNSNSTVHGIYLPPPSLSSPSLSSSSSSSSSKYPLLLVIHGGPQGAIEDSWHFRWNLAMFNSWDIGVFAINFTGSTGYGQAFTDLITHNWGHYPYQDIMAGLDHVLKTYGYLDANRVAAAGASYGGFMINWINGHTNAFKCLVNHDGVFDQTNMYFATEELYFSETEFGLPTYFQQQQQHDNDGGEHKNASLATAGNDEEKLRMKQAEELGQSMAFRDSPSRFVWNWKTPTLVIHGGKDYRVCETEGIGTFTALQRRGIPSKLLYFPNENHWVLKARNSVMWHETIKSWVAQWVGFGGR